MMRNLLNSIRLAMIVGDGIDYFGEIVEERFQDLLVDEDSSAFFFFVRMGIGRDFRDRDVCLSLAILMRVNVVDARSCTDAL